MGIERLPLERRTFLRAGGAALASWTLVPALADAPPKDQRMRFLLAWGKKGKAAGEFDTPIGLAVSTPDEIYVSEFRNNRVQRFSSEGKLLGSFAVAPMPGGLAVDREGNVYVAPLMSHKICVYSPTGKLLREWGKKGKADGEFEELAARRPGIIYASGRCYSYDGPWAQRGGFDMEALCSSGFTVEEGTMDRPAFPPTMIMNDYIAGYIGAAGIQAALIRRAKEGGSYHVRVNLTRCAMWFMSLGVLERDAIQAVGEEHQLLKPDTITANTP